MPVGRTIRCLAAIAPLVAASVAGAQMRPPLLPVLPASPTPSRSATLTPPRIAPDMALHIALDRLREEGQQFRKSGNLPRQKPDFAETFAYVVRPDDVIDAIVTVQDREDAAVDGYIRWQLLSFNVDLAGMNNEDYNRLIANLPRLARSASADTESHRALEYLAQAAGRNTEVRAELQQRWDALHFADKQVELINQPALKFRDAVADAMPETGARRLGVLLFDLQSRIDAASDTRSVKSAITRTLHERMLDDAISLEQRWELLKYVESLPSPGTKVVRDVVFYTRQPADIRYSTYAIRASDVRKWTAYLNRHEP